MEALATKEALIAKRATIAKEDIVIIVNPRKQYLNNEAWKLLVFDQMQWDISCHGKHKYVPR